MNKHFEDARYYLRRAGEHAKKGVGEELEPVGERFREVAGREEEPDPTRLGRIREDLAAVQERAEGDAEELIADARETIRSYRDEKAA